MGPLGSGLCREYVGRDEHVGRRTFFRVVVSGLTVHPTPASAIYPVVATMGEPGSALVVGARSGRLVVSGRWVAPRALAGGVGVDRHRESPTVRRHRIRGLVGINDR